MDYIANWNSVKLPNNRTVIDDIKNSLPSVNWDQIQLLDDWNEVDEIVCENVASYFVSRSFRGVVLTDDGNMKAEYVGSALYFQDHTASPGWKLNRLTLSQNSNE